MNKPLNSNTKFSTILLKKIKPATLLIENKSTTIRIIAPMLRLCFFNASLK